MSGEPAPAPAEPAEPNYQAVKDALVAKKTEVTGQLAAAKQRATQGTYLQQVYANEVAALEGALVALDEFIAEADSKIPPPTPPSTGTQSPTP